MLFLKSLLFLPANILIAFLIVYLIKALLFYPRRVKYIKGRKLPFTPGLVVKYHTLLVEKINNLVYGYLHDVETSYNGNRIDGWEQKVFEQCLDWLEERMQWKYVPDKILTAIRVFLAEFGREFARQFLRSFLPYMIKNYKIDNYVDMLNEKFTIEFLQGYYDRYIYKYSLYFMMSVALIIGIINQIIYLIIGG